MAFGEARTFRADGGVWTAEVRDHPRADWFGEAGEHGETTETVVFTRIDARQAPRAVRIAAGTLNRQSHEGIGELLHRGRIPDEIPLAPALPLPTGTEPGFTTVGVDDDCLHWAVRAVDQRREQSGGRERIVTGIDFVCLDDTALRGHFPFRDTTTLRAFLDQHGETGIMTLIPEIKRNVYGNEEGAGGGALDAQTR